MESLVKNLSDKFDGLQNDLDKLKSCSGKRKKHGKRHHSRHHHRCHSRSRSWSSSGPVMLLERVSKSSSERSKSRSASPPQSVARGRHDRGLGSPTREDRLSSRTRPFFLKWQHLRHNSWITSLRWRSKAADKELAIIQSHVLDTLAPLSAILETKEDVPEKTVKAATDAIKLLGNANARISHLRHTKVIMQVNKTLLPLVEEDSNFGEVSPSLFGPKFAQKSKELVEL